MKMIKTFLKDIWESIAQAIFPKDDTDWPEKGETRILFVHHRGPYAWPIDPAKDSTTQCDEIKRLVAKAEKFGWVRIIYSDAGKDNFVDKIRELSGNPSIQVIPPDCADIRMLGFAAIMGKACATHVIHFRAAGDVEEIPESEAPDAPVSLFYRATDMYFRVIAPTI